MAAATSDPSAQRCGRLPRLGLTSSTALFGGAGLLLFAMTHGVIPAWSPHTQTEPVVLWFASAGFGLFGPLLILTFVLLWQEGALTQPGLWRLRLRFTPMNRGDWLASLVGVIAIGLLAGASLAALRTLAGEVEMHPSFMRMAPLMPDRYWILAAWLPFWVVNIMGEEILWRGVVLPRQELAFGRWAWLVNGIGWLLFHLSFGPWVLITLAPTTLILPFAVQRRRNTWIGVVIHAGLNGPAFLALAFGLA